MALDSYYLHQLTKELKTLLRNSKVDKICQPHPLDVVIHLRQAQQSYHLFLSAHPQYARVNLTEKLYENPLKPPGFCMLLRKYLESSRLLEIEQPNFDRIMRFYFQTVYPIDGISQVVLVVEMMGKHSNFILLNRQNSRILGAIKILTTENNRYREIYPGCQYLEPPNQAKRNPLTVTERELLDFCQTTDCELSAALAQTFFGMSPQLIRELLHRNELEAATKLPLTVEQERNFVTIFLTLFQPTKTNPILYQKTNGELLDYSYLQLQHLATSERQIFPDGSSLLDFYYGQKQSTDHLKQKKKDLVALVQREWKRCQKKLLLQEKDLAKAENADTYRIKGELLYANLNQITKGQQEITLPNYYTAQPLVISLNIQLSPSANAQSYFKKYQKAKNSMVHITQQMAAAQAEKAYLEGILVGLDNVEKQQDIEVIREELQDENYLKRDHKKKVAKKATLTPLTFISSEDFPILVGKNNKENDQLTLKTARPHDLWLHVKDIPGSHVIIRCKGTVPENTLLEAANLAAYYSKAKNSSNVPVDYTEKKYVKKPMGAKPGMVIYTEQKTLFVTPTEKILLAMHKKKTVL